MCKRYVRLYAHKECCSDKQRHLCIICNRTLVGHCESSRCCNKCSNIYKDIETICVFCRREFY